MTRLAQRIQSLALATSLLTLLPKATLAQAELPKASAQNRASESDGLFTNAAIPRIRIQIPEKGIAILRTYQWEWGGNTHERTNVLATVREGDKVYTNVAIHLKGAAGSFRPIDSDKPALTLNFNKEADGQRFHGLQKIHLNNSIQDPSYASEILARELFNSAGVPAPRASHAIVELNGRDLGLYVLVEGWNKQFLKRHFKDNKGSLWDGGFGREIDRPLDLNSGPEPGDRQRLDELVAVCRADDLAERWRSLPQYLDLDRFLTFSALEVMLGHWDGYSMGHNNYRVYHDPGTDRLVFLPHGLDQLFGVYRLTPESRISPMMKGMVARAVTQIPKGRRQYFSRMSEVLTNAFIAERLTARVDAIAAKVRPALAAGNEQAHAQAVSQLKNRIERRVRSVTSQLATAETPVAFDASGEARLADWEPRRDSGNPSFNRARGSQPTLQIAATGSRAYGSWRTTVLLDAGNYQFTGKARMEDLQIGPGVTNGGVTLRYSGERKARMVTAATDWTPLTYDFTVAGLTDIELICELRASNGRVWFDVNSLKLIRKGPPARKD